MKKIILSLAVALTALFLAVSISAETAVKRPNILFAIADDWGWPHAGAYGDPVVKTPTFDRLAKEDILFNHAYVSIAMAFEHEEFLVLMLSTIVNGYGSRRGWIKRSQTWRPYYLRSSPQSRS